MLFFYRLCFRLQTYIKNQYQTPRFYCIFAASLLIIDFINKTYDKKGFESSDKAKDALKN